jgi:hypothetical protein
MAISIVNIPVPNVGDGPIVSIANLVGEKTVELSGTFKGRYILLGTQNGSKFVPVATFDSNGRESFKQTLPLALIAVRVRSQATNSVGVSLNVSGVASVGSNKFATVASVAPGSSGTQPVIDLFAAFPPTGIEQDIGFLCSGAFKGVVLVEGSLDNVEFNAIGEFTADSQSPSLLGTSPSLEFSPLTTKNLVRYVRITVDGVVTETVTVTLGGSVPASGSTPVNLPVADWNIALVRYIFLDGDNGNDINIGYIDAPAGTIFTPAQTGPVAVQTTHRLNEIRKNIGAGRSVITLIKPKVGEVPGLRVPYDNLLPGDGQGQDDRSLLSDYKLIYTRGSDLTNSFEDRRQLGFLNSFIGPNLDSSWTVGTVANTAEGPTIQLVGATLPPGWELPFFRIRYVHAGVTYYTSIHWGNVTSVATTDTLTAWYLPSGLSAGDHIWLEKPGVLLYAFNECASSDTTTATQNPATSLDGVLFAGGVVNLGHNDDPARNHYSNLGVVVGAGTSLTGTGNVQIDNSYRDEADMIVFSDGVGLCADSMFFNGSSITMSFSILADSASGDANHSSSLLSDYIEVNNVSLQTCTFAKGTLDVFMDSANYGKITCYGNTDTGISNVRGINEWNSQIIVSAADSDVAKTFSFRNMHNLLNLAGVLEPSTPGIVLQTGQYTVLLDFLDGKNFTDGGNTIECGTGVRVEYDQDGSKYTVIEYGENALGITGFEVIGGQKVISLFSEIDNGYPGSVLPCPRGTPMKIVNQPNPCGEDPPPSFAGLVVYGRAGDGGIDDGQVYYADASNLTPVRTPIGATLTNYENNIDFGDGHTGGYVLVSNDQIVVLHRNSTSPVPTIGSPVFLAYADGLISGTFATTADDDFNPVFQLGYVLPIGLPSLQHAAILWQPGHHATQTKLLHADFTKTDTALDAVPNLFVQLESGLSYKIRAHLHYQTAVSPNNGGLKLALSGDLDMTIDSAVFSFVGMQEIEDSPGTPTVPKLEWVASIFAIGDGNAQTHTGGVTGWVDIEGTIKVNVGGVVYVRFAQDTTNAAGSTLSQGSSITAIKTQ